MGVEQNRPMLTPGVAKRAVSAATARSAEATSWQPAAVAMPWTWAMTGFGQVDDALHQAGAQGEDGFVSCSGGVGADFPQVVAGAEGGAVGGEDDGVDGGVSGDGFERGVERLHQGGGQGVAGGGTVQRQGRDVVAVVAEQDIGHDAVG